MKSRIIKIERKRLADEIIDQIVGQISKGELKTGDMLPPEPVLMKEFGVGKSSLREAIGALSLTGLLSVHPGYGTKVIASADTFLQKPLEWSMSIRNETVEELIEARIVIEEAAADIAATKATNADIEELERIDKQINTTKKSKKEIVPLDILFHQMVAKASHNRVLLRYILELKHLMLSWMDQNMAFANSKKIELLQSHTDIIQAIRNKKGEEARFVMRRHLEVSSKDLRLSLIDRHLKNRVLQR